MSNESNPSHPSDPSSRRRLSLCEGPVRFAGAVSLASHGDGQTCVPWRLPHEQADLFPKLLATRAKDAAGVRLALRTDSPWLEVTVDPLEGADSSEPQSHWPFDLCVDGEHCERRIHPRQRRTLRFEGWDAGEHRLELWLPHLSPVGVSAVAIAADADAAPFDDARPRWSVYGSSITQCGAVEGPTDMWPARVAVKRDLNLLGFGFGGACLIDPLTARVLRDTPADYISLCLGINVWNGGYDPRTFRPAVIGLVRTIREGQPHTPIVVVSPIYSFERETEQGATGLTMPQMRAEIAEAVAALSRHGCPNLTYVDGLELFGQDYAEHFPDRLHPSAEGYALLAERYDQVVMPRLLSLAK